MEAVGILGLVTVRILILEAVEILSLFGCVWAPCPDSYRNPELGSYGNPILRSVRIQSLEAVRVLILVDSSENPKPDSCANPEYGSYENPELSSFQEPKC